MKITDLLSTGIHLAQGKIFGKKIPLSVVLSVTNRCNLDCAYCGYGAREKSELSGDEIRDLLDQMRAAGVRRVNFFGGEPLIRHDIGGIAAHARRRGMFVSLVTNGTLVGERLSTLDSLDLLLVSLDGSRRTHDLNRGAGSYDRAVEAIATAKGRVPVWTITTLTRNNMDDIGHVVRLARDRGFGATFQFLNYNEHLGRNYDELIPPLEECRQTIRKIMAYKKAGYPVVSSMYSLERLLRWPDFRRNTMCGPTGGLPCVAGRFYCSVDTDGTVYPCSLLIDAVKGSHYRDHGFAGAFRKLPDPPCTACLASCMIEQSYLYSLRPGALVHYAREIGRYF